ncbi:MAG: hypothetical protein QE510_06070 [Verrucomicrobiota bacterium]|jgi:hypothetical protein|nr:hypothetical protein [Verrucomicrobiota bacterium]
MKTLNPNRSWILAIGLILAGCQTPKPSLPELGARFEPKNVYRAVDALPGNLQRVVLMPVTLSTPDLATLDHRNQLAKILEEELRKTHRFEVIKATPEELRRGFGKDAFSAGEPLPADLLTRIQSAHSADGVIFAQLASYRPFPPVAIGWELRLVTADQGGTLWSIDETFDASQAEVARSARDYFRGHHTGASELADPQSDLRSPSRFCRYTAQTVWQTLPKR